MTGLTREAIVKALHDKGAYCGVCDYETALDGAPGCSECRQVLGGYADTILALAPTVPGVVLAFINQRPEYVTAMQNSNGDNTDDYFRWSGHAGARRQLAEKLGLTVPHEFGERATPKEDQP